MKLVQHLRAMRIEEMEALTLKTTGDICVLREFLLLVNKCTRLEAASCHAFNRTPADTWTRTRCHGKVDESMVGVVDTKVGIELNVVHRGRHDAMREHRG